MGIHDPDSGPLSDGANPSMGGAPVQTLAVLSAENRALGPLTDDQVERPGGSRNQRDDGWLVALAQDAEGPVPVVQGQVLDVAPTSLADPEAVEPEQDGKSGVVVVESFGRVEERPELPTVETSSSRRTDLGPTDVLPRVSGNPSVDVGEPIEPTDR